jgi:phosphoserine phosphatase
MPAATPHVLTLVSAPSHPPALTAGLVRDLAFHLPAPGEPVWLDDGYAVDIPFEPSREIDDRRLANSLRIDLGDELVDLFIQPRAFRRKRLFLADMDSTMIGQECIDELADFVGKKAEVAEITERTMRGELVFETSLRARVALLAGLDAGVVSTVIADRIKLTDGGTTLVRTMRANGAYTALVSGGFTLFTNQIAATIGFDENRANILLVEEGKFSGKVAEPILGREAKFEALVDLRAAKGLVKEETMAVGDGANDLAMIKEAGLGVAFHAKPAVAAAAHARVDHGDLTALLFAQGYRRSEFVA